jgi:hypothetical protein
MYTENIIRDLQDIIHDVKAACGNVRQSKIDAFKYDDLEEALLGLDQAKDVLLGVEDRLVQLIHEIEMETLSHKVQSK